MVEVGEISIAGTINTEGMEAGFSRIKGGLRSVADASKPVFAELFKISSVVGKLAASFGAVAIAGTGFFLGLAAKAPAVAGAMAKIKVAMGELTRGMGRALRPQFEWFADKLQGLADFVSSNPNLVGKVTTSIIGLAAAFTVFKIGGAIVTGVAALVTGITGIIGLVASSGFVTALGGLTALAGFAGLAAITGFAIYKGYQAEEEYGINPAYEGPLQVGLDIATGGKFSDFIDGIFGTRRMSLFNVKDTVWG